MSRLDATALQKSVKRGTGEVVPTVVGPFNQIMLDRRLMVRADEPASAGGAAGGLNPYDLLLMALGSCTSMTVSLYAARKKWPLEQVVVLLRQERVHLQ